MQYDRPYNDEINIGDLFTKLGEYRRYLLRKWWVILIFAVLLAATLRIYIIWHPEDYVTHCDFAVKGTEGTTTSSLASLASSFGIGITTGTEFTNELFLGILQSRRLVKQALLQRHTIAIGDAPPREDYMANFYLQMYPRWAKRKKISDARIEHGDLDSVSRYEDSVLTVIYDEITDNDLSTDFNDDLGMNQMEFYSTNRDFSFYMGDYLAYAGSDYYIDMQIRNEKSTVDLMQEKCDSLRSALTSKEDQLARLQDNSNYQIKYSGLLDQGRLIREIGIVTTEYTTTYSSLELAKFDMQNHTPLVDIIDPPQWATVKEKEQTLLFSIIGFLIGGFLSTVVLAIRKYVRDSVAESKEKQLLIEKHSAGDGDQSLIDPDSNKI